MDTSPRLRAWLRAFTALAGLALLAYVLHTAFGLGSPELDGFFQDWVYCGLIVAAGAACVTRAVAVREERAAWLVMGIGLVAWAAGEVTWTLAYANDPNPPYPSVADVLYLTFYPASYASLLLLARSRTDSFRSSLWLDGAIAALTVAALIATLAFQPIVDATSGGTGRDRGEPRVSGRRPAPAGPRRRGLRAERLAPGPGLAPPGWRPRAHGRGRRALPGAERDRPVRPGHAPRPRLARLRAAGGRGGLAARAKEDHDSGLADHGRAGRVRARGRRAARVRPLRARERRCRESRRMGPAARARPDGARLPGEPAHARPDPHRGAHGLAHGAEEPPQPAGRPRAPARALQPGRAARAAPVRPRRLQGVQRRLRPSRRRRPPGAPRRAPGRRGRIERARLPARRRRVLRAGAPRSRRNRLTGRSLLGGTHRAR